MTLSWPKVDEINKDFAGIHAIAINHALRNNFEAWKVTNLL